MAPILLPMPGAEALAAAIAAALPGATLAELALRRFPDGEHHLRVGGEVAGADVRVVARLDHPDATILPLLFAADVLRDLGVRRVGLVAPYLPYMRQDRRFAPGEAVTSASFARLISRAFDSLVTVDPHLHRRRSLDEIFFIPTAIAHAAAPIGAWIAANIERPLVVGPDEEAGQWAREAARQAGAPCVILSKTRSGDRQVALTAPDLAAHAGRTPVIVDDIVSSGGTVGEAAGLLAAAGLGKPVVLAVHALIGEADMARLAPRIARLVSTDSVTHPSNAIPVAGLLAEALAASAI